MPQRAEDKIVRRWEDKLNALVDYKNRHGDCNVPLRYRPIGGWVCWIRSHASELSQQQREQLDARGFNWETQEERYERAWNDFFNRLKAYRMDHGNCNVPRSCEDDHQLANWTHNQQNLAKKGKLLPHRRALLESIQFSWGKTLAYQRDSEGVDRNWMEYYKRLVRFHDKYGHCLVPTTYKKKKRLLGAWVCKQRLAYADNLLPDYRKELLDKIGFVYRVETVETDGGILRRQSQWERKYQELVRFLEEHGPDQLPRGNDGLGRWLSYQRIKCKEGRLLPGQEPMLAAALGPGWAEKRKTSSESDNDTILRQVQEVDDDRVEDLTVARREEPSQPSHLAKRRRLKRTATNRAPKKARTVTNSLSSLHPIGTRIRKYFPGYGWFSGSVVGFDAKRGFYDVHYDDSDEEEFTADELKEILDVGNGTTRVVEQSSPPVESSALMMKHHNQVMMRWNGMALYSKIHLF